MFKWLLQHVCVLQNVYMNTAECLYRNCRIFVRILQNVCMNTTETFMWTLQNVIRILQNVCAQSCVVYTLLITYQTLPLSKTSYLNLFNIIIIQQVVRRFYIFLRPFDNYIIFFFHLSLSFQSSSINPFSSISPLISSAQVSLGLPRFLLPGGLHFITFFGSLPSSIR